MSPFVRKITDKRSQIGPRPYLAEIPNFRETWSAAKLDWVGKTVETLLECVVSIPKDPGIGEAISRMHFVKLTRHRSSVRVDDRMGRADDVPIAV